MRSRSGGGSFIYLLILVVVVFLLYSFYSQRAQSVVQTSLTDVAAQIREGNVTSIRVEGNRVLVRLGNGEEVVSYKSSESSITEQLRDLGVTPEQLARVEIVVLHPPDWSTLLSAGGSILLVLVMFAIGFFMLRQFQGANNQALAFGKSRARMYTGDRPSVTFDDVAGVDEALEELREVVEFLKEPEKFVQLGARIPKGVLLMGAPGTGKTLLAKAVSGEAGVPFFSISGSEFVEMFVGVGASRVRDLFEQAKRHSPCIVFLDEIDAVGRHRGAGLGGSHDEREQTLNQILVEMDGFDTDTNVIVMAASVTGDTPVMVRTAQGEPRLLPIAEVIDPYYADGEAGVEKPSPGLQALGLQSDHSGFVSVRGVYRHKVDEIYEIEYAGGKVRATGNHSVFVYTQEGMAPRAVAELQPGDELVALAGTWADATGSGVTRVPVQRIRRLPYDGYVYDLCGCEREAFFGGESPILLHNTNRPDILDPALLRPGRFDRRIVLDRPDLKGREAILAVHVRGKPLAEDVDLKTLARATPGFVGADIESLVNEAAILAARRNKKVIGMAEFQESIERVIAGPERKSRLMSEEEKRITAYHEAGHAVVAHVLPNCDPVHKVSIVARGMAAGYTIALPEEERRLLTKSKLEDDLAYALGGRTAEELVFGDVTTGAANDLERVTEVARAMVTRYGMSDSLGPMTFGQKEELVFLGKEIGEQRDYSEAIAQEIDIEVRKIVNRAHERAREVLTRYREQLDRVAQRLIEVETLDAEEFVAVFEGRETPDTPKSPLPASGAKRATRRPAYECPRPVTDMPPAPAPA